MDAMVCPNCRLSIVPIKLFDRSPKTGKPYLLIQCPRERCKFFIDIEDYTGKSIPPKSKEKPEPDDNGRSFWRYGL